MLDAEPIKLPCGGIFQQINFPDETGHFFLKSLHEVIDLAIRPFKDDLDAPIG